MLLLGLLLDLELANGMGLVQVDIAFLGGNNSEFRSRCSQEQNFRKYTLKSELVALAT